MTGAHTWVNGRSEAIRIHPEFSLTADEEIAIHRIGDTMRITHESEAMRSFLHGLDSFTDDFMADGRPEQSSSLPDMEL